MTETQCLKWIKTNLGPVISKAIADSGPIPYTESLIAAMVMRETGIIIMRNPTLSLAAMSQITRGDYGHRKGETEKQYHGFGFMQIDIASFPDFVKSGNWKDPYKTFIQAIKVLEAKRKYLGNVPLQAVVAAYNCGEGNVSKAIKAGKDVDTYTYNHDYSKEVWRFMGMYDTIPTDRP